MKFEKVRFLVDAQSQHTGNEFYKAGATATLRESHTRVLVDGGIAEYATAEKKAATVRPEKPEPPKDDVTAVKGVGDELAEVLKQRGFLTVADLANAKIADLTPIPGIGMVKAKSIIEAARQSSAVVSVVKT